VFAVSEVLLLIAVKRIATLLLVHAWLLVWSMPAQPMLQLLTAL